MKTRARRAVKPSAEALFLTHALVLADALIESNAVQYVRRALRDESRYFSAGQFDAMMDAYWKHPANPRGRRPGRSPAKAAAE